MIPFVIMFPYIMAIVIMAMADAGLNTTTLNDCQQMNTGDEWDKGRVTELQKDCFNLDDIDCSNATYSKDVVKTLAIMKYCTGGEKNID